MVTALRRYNGGRVLVFVMGAFAEMSEDVSRICGIIAHDLARTHVSYYNDDAKRTKGMYGQRTQKAWGQIRPKTPETTKTQIPAVPEASRFNQLLADSARRFFSCCVGGQCQIRRLLHEKG